MLCTKMAVTQLLSLGGEQSSGETHLGGLTSAGMGGTKQEGGTLSLGHWGSGKKRGPVRLELSFPISHPYACSLSQSLKKLY